MRKNLNPLHRTSISVLAILKGLCPSCRAGKATTGPFSMQKRCPKCSYNFYPEPGFYLGAMAVGFFITAAITIPPTIILKILDVDIAIVLAAPFVVFATLGTLVLYYCKVIWLHLEYKISRHLEMKDK